MFIKKIEKKIDKAAWTVTYSVLEAYYDKKSYNAMINGEGWKMDKAAKNLKKVRQHMYMLGLN